MDRYAKLREVTAASVPEIERGEKPRLQGTLANLYFGFNPGPHAHELRDQLMHAVGVELTASAERGFVALLFHQTPPIVAELARMNAANEYHPHWYAILAGMDLYWEEHQSIENLSQATVGAVFGLSLLLSTWDEEGHLAPASRRPWSKIICQHHPAIASQVYENLLTELLRDNKDALSLLDRLAETPESAWRSVLARRLLAIPEFAVDRDVRERLNRLAAE